MTDDDELGHVETSIEIVDGEKYIHIEATRETSGGGARIEHRTARATHIGAEVGVVLLGWRDDGPIINLTGAEWVE